MKFNTGKYKKTLDQTLDIFDEFLDNITTSKISNKDYNVIHKIFDKYLKKNNQEKKNND
tara:strand:+ start:52 stop:228 length:177 start_codon:yes stop_codon:yes gene_type:complete